MPAQQTGWQVDRNGLPLVGGDADATASASGVRGNGAPQRQPATSSGSLHEDDVVASLWKMPQAGQLADVEQTGSTKRRQQSEVCGSGADRAHDQTIAGRQRKRPVRRCQLIESRLNGGWIGEDWSNDADAELDLATRILSVCDVYDALVSPRVYRSAWPREKALALLRNESHTAFDGRCVAALERLVAQPVAARTLRVASVMPAVSR